MAKKVRISVPSETSTQLMFDSDRTCCVCRESGRPSQIHHIDENPSNNKPDNLAMLCLHCHHETQIKGGFNRKLDAASVKFFRNDWHKRIFERRLEADRIALASIQKNVDVERGSATHRDLLPANAAKLANYLRTLPSTRRSIYNHAQILWSRGGRQDIKQGLFDITDVIEQILVSLTSWYPPYHFDGKDPWVYINDVKSSRFEWHWAHRFPIGFSGGGGSAIMIEAADCVLSDLESMVVAIVLALSQHVNLPFELWEKEWNSASETSTIGKWSAESGFGEIVPPREYAKRILGRWLGRRKYVVFYADGRWGIQRNEDAPTEIDGRTWRIEGNKLSMTFRSDSGLATVEDTIVAFMTKQFITEFEGHKESFDWAP